MENKVLDLLIEDGEAYITSLQLAELTGKKHFHVLRDVRELQNKIATLKDTYSKSKNGLEPKNIQSFLDSLALLKCNAKNEYINGKLSEIFSMNREFTTEMLMNYSFEIRLKVQNVFWSVSDKLKESGYVHSSYSTLNDNVNNVLNTLSNRMIGSAKLIEQGGFGGKYSPRQYLAQLLSYHLRPLTYAVDKLDEECDFILSSKGEDIEDIEETKELIDLYRDIVSEGESTDILFDTEEGLI